MTSIQSRGRLHNRVAIITGSSSGLGRAISHLFASEGAKCFLVDKYPAPRNSINAETGKADDWNNRAQMKVSSTAATTTTTTTTTATTENNDQNAATSEIQTQPASQEQTDRQEEILKRIQAPLEPTHDILSNWQGQDRVKFHQADLTNEEEVITAVETCIKTFNRIDILINSHGISVESTHAQPLRCHETSLSDFQITQSINSTSLFLTCKHVLKQFVSGSQDQIYTHGRGWIVNVASVQGLTPYYATSSYCASKGAAVMLTRQIALDYARDGIRCNAICPGFLNTDMTRNLQGDGALLRSVAVRQPLDVRFPAGQGSGDTNEVSQGGLGQVSDVARMVLVMASDDAKWMTGQPVVVDGGYTLS